MNGSTLRAACAMLTLMSFVSSGASSKKRRDDPSSKDSCTKEIRQADLPLTICKQGMYCINTNLTWGGPQAAITIKNTKNVTITGNFSTLTLTNPTVVGVDILNSQFVTTEKFSILNTSNTLIKNKKAAPGGMCPNSVAQSTTAPGISMDIGSSDIVIQNPLLANCRVEANGSSRVLLTTPLTIQGNTEAGALLRSCSNIDFVGVFFLNNGIALILDGDASTIQNKYISLSGRSLIQGSTGPTSILAKQVEGLIIKDITVEASGQIGITQSLAQFGDES